MEGERVGDGKVRGWRVGGWEDERVGGLCMCDNSYMYLNNLPHLLCNTTS